MNINFRSKFVWIPMLIGGIIYIFLCFREIKQTREMEFCGVVQSVDYDIQGNATVVINDSIYKPRSNNWAFDGQVQKGDILIKVKNSMTIKLIKQKTRRQIYYN